MPFNTDLLNLALWEIEMGPDRWDQGDGPCLGCGHAKRNHINGEGLCLVRSCHLCLIYRPT